MYHLLLFSLILVSSWLQAQPGGARAAGRFMFQDSHPYSDSLQSSISLPLWHPYAQVTCGGYLAAMNRYGLMALTECLFGGSRAIAHGSVRWSGSAAGDGRYQQVSGQFMLVRHLSERFQLGTGIGFSYAAVAGYGARWTPVGSLTAGGLVGSRTVWGMCWDNPQQLVLDKGWFGLSPMRIRVGIAHALSTRLSIYSGMEWEPGLANGSMIQLIYRPAMDWRLRLGTGWRPDQFLFGVDRRLRQGWVGFGFAQDWQMGSTFQVAYTWHTEKRTKP